MTTNQPQSITKRRLLVLASTYPRWPGDHEPGFVHSLCARLSNTHQIWVICPAAPGTTNLEVMDGVTIKRFRYAPRRLETLVANGGILTNLRRTPWKWLLVPFFFIGLILATLRALHQLRPEAIHCHWIIPQGIALWAINQVTRLPPILLTSHGGDLFGLDHAPGRWLKRRALRNASMISVVSEAMLAPAQALGVPPDRLAVAPMGVGFSTDWPEKDNSPRTKGLILFVGRLVKGKGLDCLIRALPGVLLQYPAARLVIAGGGPERSAMEALAAELQVSACVCFLGPVEHDVLPDWYKRASAFCAPYTGNEGLGLVTPEAISFRCPVLVGDIPAVRDIVAPRWRDACLINPVDTEAFSNKLAKLLQMPPPEEQITSMQQHVLTTFTWPAVATRYEYILNQIADPAEHG